MINNYEVNFKLKELISAFFTKSKSLNFPKKMRYMYELFSGRDAISFILKGIESKKGVGEVICPNYSCKAIPRAIFVAGFKPIFVDVDNEISLDIKEIKKAINEKTKAIIYYHPWGFLHSKDIIEIARKNKINLIEDCCQILGKDVGNLGDYSFFSFRTSKLIGVGTGAIVFSKDEIKTPINKNSKFIEFVDLLDLTFRSKIKNFSKPRAIFEKIERIKNRSMGNFEKNLLVNEINNLEENIKKRINNYKILREIVEKTKNFKNIPLRNPISPLYFPVICNKKEKALELFKKEKINATGFYCHVNSDCFNEPFFGDKNSRFFSKNLINLPLHEKLNEIDLEKIKDIIIKIDKNLNEI